MIAAIAGLDLILNQKVPGHSSFSDAESIALTSQKMRIYTYQSFWPIRLTDFQRLNSILLG
jgi:hypothetical protein